MYTIFKNDTSIILTDQGFVSGLKNHFLWRDINQGDRLKRLLATKSEEVFLHDKDLDAMWREFAEHFMVIEASGGIVVNEHTNILFIYRNDKWDLPKGKIEVGESREEAALREVEEECGFTCLDLGKFIGTTYHIYEERDIEVLKVSYWYEMFSNQTDLIPQLEEGITALRWTKRSDMGLILNNTYPNIHLLLQMYEASFQ